MWAAIVKSFKEDAMLDSMRDPVVQARARARFAEAAPVVPDEVEVEAADEE